MVQMVDETLALECPIVSPVPQKVSFGKSVTCETTSTTDDASRQEDSDDLSDITQDGCNEFLTTTSDDGAFESDLEDEISAENCFMSGFRTPDPLDFMPVAQVPTAFSEQEIAQTMARLENVAQQQVFPGACAMPMQAMPQMGAGGNFTVNGAMMVPVPMPMAMPKMVPMPFPMSAPLPQQVPVPPGFKLVKIPEPTQIKEETETKTASYSEISDPLKTERKIFVGGLSPVTTEESLVEYFSKYGAVADAKVIRDGEKSKGFAFVQFVDPTPPQVLESVHFIDQRRCGVGLALQRQR
jgi:hypothetical protein